MITVFLKDKVFEGINILEKQMIFPERFGI